MSDSITITTEQQTLRAELKQWEKTFATTHGRKPTRDDIKLDGKIGAKYTQFNRLARNTTHSTPRKRVLHPEHVLAAKCSNVQASLSTDEELIEPTPAHIRGALGPTPQKDGIIMGLFDFGSTPSKAEHAVAGTPSKSLNIPANAEYSRTPQSSSKRFFYESFAGTPMKRKREDETTSPVSVKEQFATPAFLRRDTTFESIAEEEDGSAAVPRPRRKKSMARSFSSILAGLKEQVDERMDDDWDILKELENEEAAGHEHPLDMDAGEEDEDGQSTMQATTAMNADVAQDDDDHILVEDSQAPEMPLGPDQGPISDEDDEETTTTRKPWKKKGLKRQTKKSNMKPVLHAPKKAAELEVADAEEKPSDNIVKKVVRKVNEAAHMNFRRLKIKSKNSKPNTRGGRFARR